MILLIGYGNSLRRDDGAGPALARALAARFENAAVRLLCPHQLSPELAWEISRPEVKTVLFADASAEPGGAAPLLRLLEAGGDGALLGHALGPGELLGLAEKVFGRRPPAWLAAVPGFDFGFGEGLSEPCRAALGQAEAEAMEVISALV